MKREQRQKAGVLSGVRVAMLTRVLPEPGRFGSLAYIYSILKGLHSLGAEVEVWLAEGQLEGLRPVIDVDPGLESFATVRIARSLRWGRRAVRPSGTPRDVAASVAKTLFGRLPNRLRAGVGPLGRIVRAIDPAGSFKRPPTAAERAFFCDELARLQPHVVLANTVFLGPVFERPPFDRVPVRAVVTHDVTFERVASLAQQQLEFFVAGWSRADEQRALRGANAVLAIQPDDAAVFAQLVDAANVVHLPMPIDPAPVGPGSTAGRMLFVGSPVEPNIVGLRFFVDEVLPLIRDAMPHATLEVCGGVSEHIDDAPGVIRSGYVADLAPHYRDAAVVVVPLVVGSGLKIKLAEALARGRAVVSTSVGLQGVVSDGQPPFGRRADTPRAFADASLELLGDDAARVRAEEAALAWVAGHYATPIALAALLTRIETLLEPVRQ